MLDDLQHKGLI